jgi:hypothetical protein
MTDSSHLEAFERATSATLSKRLVATFTTSHRDPSLKAADVVTRLKDVMEQGIAEGGDAPARTDGS